jgi:hypothetical protein
MVLTTKNMVLNTRKLNYSFASIGLVISQANVDKVVDLEKKIK